MTNKTNQSLYSVDDINTMERLIDSGVTLDVAKNYVRNLIIEHPTATGVNRRRASRFLRDTVNVYDVLKLMRNTRAAFERAKRR